MTFLPFLLNRSRLPICSYYFFLFWPVTLQTLNGSSYSRSQHLTRLANDFPVFLLNRSKLPICSHYFFIFWPVTLQTLEGSSTAPNKASQLLSCLFCLTGRGYQYAHTIFFYFRSEEH